MRGRAWCLRSQLRQRERRIQQLAADLQLYERLVASLAPNIYGLDDVKKGLLCQLFGGCGKTFPGGRVRGEINVLLVRARDEWGGMAARASGACRLGVGCD